MEEASFLAKYGSKVYVLHRRDELRASKIMQERVLENPKIEMLWSTTVDELHGSDLLEAITVLSTKDGSRRKVEVGGLFYAIGHVPNTAFLEGQLETNETGYIVLKHGQETSVRGVFAAGDVHDFRYRQAITAAGAGCAAALDAEHFLSGLARPAPLRTRPSSSPGAPLAALRLGRRAALRGAWTARPPRRDCPPSGAWCPRTGCGW